MNNKIDMSIEYNPDFGYIIDFDEGISDKFNCYINERDIVSMNFGNTTYRDYDETKQRRKQIIEKMLFNELLGEEASHLLEIGEFHFDGIFKRFEKYIIDNDIFVSRDYIEEELFSKNKEYQISFDKQNEIVTIIINDKRIRDIFGISINKDNSFDLYTKRSKEELTRGQIEFLQNTVKDFVKRKLNLIINFGRDLNGPIKIKGLYDSALKLIEFAKYEDSEIESVTYGK